MSAHEHCRPSRNRVSLSMPQTAQFCSLEKITEKADGGPGGASYGQEAASGRDLILRPIVCASLLLARHGRKLLTMAESASVVRELSDRHLQSVVSLQVQWKDPSQEGRQEIICSATGSIIQASLDFLFILTCSHTFKPFCVSQGPDLDSVETINKNTNLQVDFYDAHVESGQVHAIDWLQDMCLIVVPFPLKSTYEPIRFIDDEDDMMGQSVYTREAKVYSIYCFPTSHKDKKCLFGTTAKGEICGRNDLVGNDLDQVYRPDLKIFEFDMAGAAGCSGAPIFSKDFLFIGMWLARVDDLKFALKLDHIQQWAHTWFNITRSRTMNEIVAKASACMSVELGEFQVDISSLEMEIDEIVDGLDFS